MTDMMRAVEISEPGGPEVLRLTERPVPEPEHGGVVIRVAWAGVIFSPSSRAARARRAS